MARHYEVKYGTIKNNLLKDINKKRKDYTDLESPIVQRFGGDVWATGRASMVYVIPENKFDLPYEIKEDRASEMKSILLKVSGVDKYNLDFDCVTSSRNFKSLLKFHVVGKLNRYVHLNAKLVKKFGDYKRLVFVNNGDINSPVGIYKYGVLVGVKMPIRL